MANAKVPEGMAPWIQKHVDEYLQSGGREGHLWDSSAVGGPGKLPTLLLTTKGRKTGTPFLVPLLYGEVPNGVVIVASKGGAPADPGWYRNLVANPEVEVQVGTETFRARAKTVSGAEREALWQQMAKIWPPYEDYKKKTSREIPVVVLERI